MSGSTDWFVNCEDAGFHGAFTEADAYARAHRYDHGDKPFYCGPHTVAQDKHRAHRMGYTEPLTRDA